MTRKELEEAGEELDQASAAETGDTQERLFALADELETLANRGEDPDHGRLDRVMNSLSEVEAEANEDAKAHVRAAREAVRSYRETVEGV